MFPQHFWQQGWDSVTDLTGPRDIGQLAIMLSKSASSTSNIQEREGLASWVPDLHRWNPEKNLIENLHLVTLFREFVYNWGRFAVLGYHITQDCCCFRFERQSDTGKIGEIVCRLE